MSRADLLPCPFCGGQAQDDFIKGESYLIECYECRAQAGARDNEPEAIAAWNRRASPAPIGDGLTERKTAEIMTRGYRQVGYVLQSDAGDYCLSTRGGVRWLSAEHHRKLMGGSNEVLLACLDDLRTAQARIAELEAGSATAQRQVNVTKSNFKELLRAAETYAMRYVQDEADDLDVCISEQQHEDAKDLFAVIEAAKTAVATPVPPACWCRTCAIAALDAALAAQAPVRGEPGESDAEDAARLDWLEKEIKESAMVRLLPASDRFFVQIISFGKEVRNAPPEKGIRAAIDAARKAGT